MTVQTQYPSTDDACLAQQAFPELFSRRVRSIYRYHLAHISKVRAAEALIKMQYLNALHSA